ncbi:MAG TPA: DUF2950 family protein, partial [Planctomycetota bacterium]|nr:DUF2950 family protein [Planctomycetota bacterium]
MGVFRAVALAVVLASPLGAAGAAPQDEDKKKVEDLEKQVTELLRRVKALEDQVASLKKTANPAAAEAAAGAIAANEKAAGATLKTLATAEADFRTNDRDGNGIHDYWVGDVSGLYRYLNNNKELKLIDRAIADADASPLKASSLTVLKHDQPIPRSGYLFAALPKFVEKEKPEAYHTGGFRNTHHFGIAAYPVEYGKSGKMTFVISETNILWKKDLGGKAPDL